MTIDHEEFQRLADLATRLVASGPKCCAVSASECHEISDGVDSLLTAIRERDAEVARLLMELRCAQIQAEDRGASFAAARAEVARLRKRLRGSVLTPLAPAEIEAALHAGAVESAVARGDNAWTSLVRQRDRYRAVFEAACAYVDNEPASRNRIHYCAMRNAVDAARKGDKS
jgi:hypothetical protein